MDTQKSFALWLANATEDRDVAAELAALSESAASSAVEDRFYRELEFGTGGLRGVIGAGTNRMNIYTAGRATQGLADYILQTSENHSAAIAYDSRIKSDVFAKTAACVLAANGITAHLYPCLMPTPALSFAVRELHCAAGICVTASHNPAKYNGYKVYGEDGCQITLEAAENILSRIAQVDVFEGVKRLDYEAGAARGLIREIPQTVTDAFLAAVYAQRASTADCSCLKVVYTPLNGAGLYCVSEILKTLGVGEVTPVEEQRLPDGNFPTCPYPNPEIREALQKGLELCERVRPDLLLATDPDCDRVGIAVQSAGEYQLLTGNEVGVLLLDFVAKGWTDSGKMPANPVAVKTIVTTDMAQGIAEHYGIELREVLTGFKFIGEQIGLLEKEGQPERYIFGFEESYGYLSGGYVRDKDAVGGCMLICEMAAWYKERGLTLVQALEALYETYGRYKNGLSTFEFPGAAGMNRMHGIMARLRAVPPERIGGLAVTGVQDYLTAGGSLPCADVIAFRLEGESKIIVRPSGTEPKMKIYFSVRGESEEEAQAALEHLTEAAKALMD